MVTAEVIDRRQVPVGVTLAAAAGARTVRSAPDAAVDRSGSTSSAGVIEEGSPEALGVLGMLNDAGTTQSTLDIDAALHKRVATTLVVHRNYRGKESIEAKGIELKRHLDPHIKGGRITRIAHSMGGSWSAGCTCSCWVETAACTR